jgi:hypothetical protein
MNRQSLVFPLSFSSEHSANDIINLGNLPADARVLSVELLSKNYNSTADISIGHGASTSYSANPTAFSFGIFGLGGPDVMQRIDGRGQKCDEQLPLQLKFNAATSDLSGSDLVIVFDYVQE